MKRIQGNSKQIASAFFGFVVFAAASVAAAAPNFIVILADDLGWTSLSTPMDAAAGEARSDFHRTPNLDDLVASGMRFSNAYAAAPVCSPTRYSIQFGKTPARLRRTRSERRNLVDHDQPTLPQILKSIDADYRTAHFGKWHIAAEPEVLGYDVHDGRTNNETGGFVDGARQWDGYVTSDPKRVDSLTRRAIAFLEEVTASERPFFVQLSHYAVHSNIEYSADSHALFSDRPLGELHSNTGYAAMLFDLDASIGELLRAYDRLGLGEDTYVLFLSDNGGMPAIPMQVSRGAPYPRGMNSPLLRGKWDLTEGGVRVPFVVRGPGITAGSQSNTPVVTYDLLPTIVDLAGGADALPPDLDGGSFRAVLSDPRAPVERAFDGLIFHYPHYNRVGMNEPHSAIRRADDKLIHFPLSGRSLLFDLSSDIGERRDLAAERPDLVRALVAELSAYLLDVDAERPEEGSRWDSVGEGGRVRTRFFERYHGERAPTEATGEP